MQRLRHLSVLVTFAAMTAALAAQGRLPIQAVSPTRVAVPATHPLTPSWQPIALAPDGRTLAFAANGRLFVQPTTGGAPAAVADAAAPQGVSTPVFSPDGRSLAFWSAADQNLRRIPVAGGTSTVLCAAEGPAGLEWSTGDQLLFGQGTKGIMRVSANGGTPETVAAATNGEFLVGPRLLPGNALLFSSFTAPAPGTQGPPRGQIVAQRLGTTERKVLIDALSEARYVSSGHLLYPAGGELLAVRFDPASLDISGVPVPVLQDVRMGFAQGTAIYGVADTGALVYLRASEGRFDVALVAQDGRRESMGTVPDTVFAPRISPDGKRLALDIQGSVWVADLANLSQLRNVIPAGPTTGSNQFPQWNAAGDRLAFISTRDGGVQSLFLQQADGSGTAELLVRPARSPESWSAESGRLTYITLKGTSDYDIWSYSLRDRTAAPLVETATTAQLSSKFSHDGQWVAYAANDSGRFEVYVQPAAGGARIQVSTEGGSLPVWSPDDRELFYANAGQLHAVAIRTQPTPPGITAAAAVPLPITGFIQQGSVYARRQYDIGPDGRFLMMFRQPTTFDVVANWADDLKRRVPTQSR